MSKIRFNHISEDEVAIILDKDVPLEMVDALTKSLEAKGMYEDTVNSSVTYRTFLRKGNNADDIADELIKSLQGLAKEDAPYYSKASIRATREKNAINDRRAQAKLPPLNESQIHAAKQPKPVAPVAPVAPVKSAGTNISPSPHAGSTQSGPSTIPGVHNKLHGGYSSQAMAYGTKTKKSEDEEENEDTEIEKSGYGPKGAGQYSAVDNARRKANNTGDAVGVGPNVNAKSFSSKPGQMSAKQQASVSAQIQARANKKMPVKTLSPEEIEAQYGKQPMKKSEPWVNHNSIPSAEEEIMKFAKSNQPQTGEDVSANQLMNLMQNKNMLGEKVHPAIKDMFAAPPPQPTDQQMFGHLAVTEEMEKANNEKWQKGAFGWLAEAAQPISQRFASEEEEMAYWSRIKISDSGGDAGY